MVDKDAIEPNTEVSCDTMETVTPEFKNVEEYNKAYDALVKAQEQLEKDKLNFDNLIKQASQLAVDDANKEREKFRQKVIEFKPAWEDLQKKYSIALARIKMLTEQMGIKEREAIEQANKYELYKSNYQEAIGALVNVVNTTQGWDENIGFQLSRYLYKEVKFLKDNFKTVSMDKFYPNAVIVFKKCNRALLNAAEEYQGIDIPTGGMFVQKPKVNIDPIEASDWLCRVSDKMEQLLGLTNGRKPLSGVEKNVKQI